MKSIGEILSISKPKVSIMSKKMVVSLISEKVKINENKLKNWYIVARMLKGLTNEEATRVYYCCEQGTYKDSTDFAGVFFHEVKLISKIRDKKLKQGKLKL